MLSINAEQKEWIVRPILDTPSLRQVEGTKYWEFVQPYNVSLLPPSFPLRLEIPAGWRFDRGSVPAFIPNWIISKDSLGCVAPAVHDAGYSCHGIFNVDINAARPYIVDSNGNLVPYRATRSTVDKWLLLYLLRQRIPAWRCYSAYFAVRGFWETLETLGLSNRWIIE